LHDIFSSFVLPGRKAKNNMPPKAAYERSGVKPAMSSMTNHRNPATQRYFSYGRDFFSVSSLRGVGPNGLEPGKREKRKNTLQIR
jgi:hypothetical protein